MFKWSTYYQNTLPVGFMLREEYGARWLRVHSLPNSKRYPEGKEDEIEVCKRSLESAKDVLGASNITVYFSIYDESKDAAISGSEWLKSLDFKSIEYKDVSEDDEDPYYLITFGAKFDWDEELFQQIILDVAKENISYISFYSKETKGVFSPYDGGADLFYLEPSKREQAQVKFKKWISPREDGL
ncbi:MAG: hypothetical protein H6618_06355 [Deltaproteobacteria bacterium]|nr:hypothetical protein [Deltaproteobacteria bacterium]